MAILIKPDSLAPPHTRGSTLVGRRARGVRAAAES